MIPETVQRSLTLTATVTGPELRAEGRSSANDPDEYPRARIVERRDACRLCRAVHGMVLAVGSSEYREWRAPSHPGCRRVLSYIHRESPSQGVTFVRPEAALIRTYGPHHPEGRPQKREVPPARPAGAAIRVRQQEHLETGASRTVTDWGPWWDRLGKRMRTWVTWAREERDPQKLAGILERIGITNTSDPLQVEKLLRIGLGDRLEGWIDLPRRDRDAGK